MSGVVLLAICLCPPFSNSQDRRHRIGIRTINKHAEFFDRATNKKFVPRGNNYIRLAPQRNLDGSEILYHSTFSVDGYDTTRIEQALQKMKRRRYNVVRVFLSYLQDGGIGGSGDQLSQRYMKNVTDFLRRAKSNGIFVMFTIDWIPIQKREGSVERLWCLDFQCTNANILTPEGLSANQVFFMQFVQELRYYKAPIDYIFAYELRNELTFDPQLPPLSLAFGAVKTANGKTYDMSKPVEKRRMLEEGLVYWIDQVRAKIKSVDPDALVTVGFVPPKDEATSVAQGKLSVTVPAFQHSTLDFIDVHVYPVADGATIQEFVGRFSLAAVKDKPIIMGELGAFRQSYPSREAAARDLRNWQANSSRVGFSGWILWAWDLHELPETFNAQDENEIVDLSMAPAVRPDASVLDVPESFDRNIAFGKSVSSSREIPQQSASRVVDGTMEPWGAGDFAPQWIEINLARPTSISLIRLVVNQTPTGETIHQILVRSRREEYRVLREIRQRTSDSQILEFDTLGLTNIQYVKVLTVQSPSWVGWREIEILK